MGRGEGRETVGEEREGGLWSVHVRTSHFKSEIDRLITESLLAQSFKSQLLWGRLGKQSTLSLGYYNNEMDNQQRIELLSYFKKLSLFLVSSAPRWDMGKKGTSAWSLHLIVLLLVSSLDMWAQPYPLSPMVPIPSGEAFHPYFCLSKINQVYALNTPSGLHPHVSLTPSSSSHSWNITGLCREERIQAVLHYPCSELGHSCLQPEHCPYVPAHEGWVHRGLSDFLVLFHHSCRGSWLQNMKKISNVSK